MMPNVFNPEFLFAYRNWKSIMNKIRENLSGLCDSERKVNIKLIKWSSKFTAEIKDVCRLELVQISGINISNSTPSTDAEWGQKNLYTVLFTTTGNFDNSTEAFDLYNKICRHSVQGID